jgi:hypothetical protein
MGTQQVLRAALLVVVAATSPSDARRLGDSVAVIDLGPPDEKVRQQIGAALVAAGLEPLTKNGVEDALAGIDRERDVTPLAAAMADAQSKFGALACNEATPAARTAIELAAARQAAGIAVPELTRAWTYVLLCADRTGDTRSAQQAATHLRTLGDISAVDGSILARYPEIDALSNREVMELEIKTEVPNADVWVDFKPVGKAPLKLVLTTGTHVIAAGVGSQRGVLTGTVVKTQPTVTVLMPDQAGHYSKLAERIASWSGKLPAEAELEAVMHEVGSRVAVIRYGNTVEAWGHAGKGEKLRRLGGDDGLRPLSEVAALAALISDRVDTWNDRAPDPDQPLLVETPAERKKRGRLTDEDEPTQWWVYATIAGALVAGAVLIYVNDSADKTQRVELRYP